jgi:transposase
VQFIAPATLTTICHSEPATIRIHTIRGRTRPLLCVRRTSSSFIGAFPPSVTPTVWRWQEAYLEGGIERLLKDKGKGPKAGKPRVSDEVRLKIVTMTAKEKPANATHWSARTLARQVGVGHTTVQRVWKEHGLKPHLTRSFKLSNDPQLQRKLRILLGFISIRRTTPWCCRLTKKARFKRLIAHSRAFP